MFVNVCRIRFNRKFVMMFFESNPPHELPLEGRTTNNGDI